MAEVSNCTPALDRSPNQLLWEKLVGKVKSSKIYSPLALDKISSRNSNGGKQREEFGMRLPSFEANQSFPRISRSLRCFSTRNSHHPIQPSSLPRLNMEHMSGDGQHSLSFTRVTAPIVEEKSGSPTRQGNLSFLNSFGPPSSPCLPVFNPSKAVFTIDSKSTEILVVNDAACNLLEYPASELVGTHLCDLMGRTKTQTALSEEHLDGDMSNVVSFCGKVVEMVAKSGEVIPVSLWITNLHAEETGGINRCLAVAEPVEMAVAEILIDKQGSIISADICAEALFQYELKELLGMGLKDLIPSFKLPTDTEKHLTLDEKKQKSTGRTLDGENFPLSLILDKCLDTEGVINYSVIIWVFASMSGLMVLGSDGIIEGCNHHFVQLMFGYSRAEIIGKKITSIIPEFCEKEIDKRKGMSFGSPPSSSTICPDVSRVNKLESTTPSANKKSQILGMKGRMSSSSIDDVIDSMGKLNVAYFSLSHSETEPETPKHQRRQRSSLAIERGRNVLSGVKESPSTPVKGMDSESEQQCEGRSDLNGVMPIDQSEDLLVTSTPAMHFKGGGRKNLISQRGNRKHLEENEESPSRSRIVSLDPEENDNTIKPPDPYTNGEYYGYGLHKDGALLNVKYRVQRAILTGSNRLVYCVWVAKNTNIDAEVTVTVGGGCKYGSDGKNIIGNLTLAPEDEFSTSGSACNCDSSLTKIKKTSSGNNNLAQKNVMNQLSHSKVTSAFKVDNGKEDTEDDDIVDGFTMEEGEYQHKYSSLYQIGKGAFGCVCMGYRKSDNLLVITKFIRKEKVCEESWVVDPKMERRVPLEISLLTTLKHPNIVSVLDVCENPTYFQLVMEKHGAGMDLFEFIDRNPDLDEPLISYIFRQVAAAVDYLHSLQILHRDIKDENIILNEAFHAKLIDFGSATFSSPGRLFSNFYGTVEYCSPEVLAGNKYAGSELEMWSMGVTLYVLCFGENPFFDVEETLKAELNPPYTVSEGLQQLLEWMLEKDPSKRCTVEQLVDHPWLNQHVDISQYIFNEVVQCKPHEENPPTHFDEGEEVGSSYFSGMYLSEKEEVKEEDDEGSAEDEGGVQGYLDAGSHQSFYSSFSCISPSSSYSSPSHSAVSSMSCRSASHSRGSTSSTVTSTRSITSMTIGPTSKEINSFEFLGPSVCMGATREEESEAEQPKASAKYVRGDKRLDDADSEDLENIFEEKANGMDHSPRVRAAGKKIGRELFVRTEDRRLDYDELDDDSSFDELDSLS